MASINKVILVGNLGHDPEVRYLPNGGTQVTSIALATTDRWRDKATGEQKEATEWHRVSFFGKLAEIAGKYLKKGSQVYIEGSLRTRKFTDKTGAERGYTEIVASEMQLLDKKTAGSAEQKPAQPAQSGGSGRTCGFKEMAESKRAPAQASEWFSSETAPDDEIPF